MERQIVCMTCGFNIAEAQKLYHLLKKKRRADIIGGYFTRQEDAGENELFEKLSVDMECCRITIMTSFIPMPYDPSKDAEARELGEAAEGGGHWQGLGDSAFNDS
jgi:DNA-directed RNA polymerase subunit N (RpoN/RPB10)